MFHICLFFKNGQKGVFLSVQGKNIFFLLINLVFLEILELGSYNHLAQHTKCSSFFLQNHSTLLSNVPRDALRAEAKEAQQQLRELGTYSAFYKFFSCKPNNAFGGSGSVKVRNQTIPVHGLQYVVLFSAATCPRRSGRVCGARCLTACCGRFSQRLLCGRPPAARQRNGGKCCVT